VKRKASLDICLVERSARGVGKLISAGRNGLLKVTRGGDGGGIAHNVFLLSFPNKREEFALTALSCYNGEKLTRK
jgi:hypothetical protein